MVDERSAQREPTLDQVLEEILHLFAGSLNFAGTATDNLPEIVAVAILTTVAVSINLLALRDLGGRLGPERGKGLVEQVIGAAFQTFAGEDPHPEPFDKAAMLLRGITQGHPFSDGNKRTGFMMAAYYLERAGYPHPLSLPREEIVAFCLQISAGKIRDVRDIAHRLAAFWAGRSPG